MYMGCWGRASSMLKQRIMKIMNVIERGGNKDERRMKPKMPNRMGCTKLLEDGLTTGHLYDVLGIVIV